MNPRLEDNSLLGFYERITGLDQSIKPLERENSENR